MSNEQASRLEWKGAPGNVIARGDKGLYTIQTVGSAYVLQGFGADEKPLRELGFFGHGFSDLDAAKNYASELDKAVAQ